MRFFDGWRSLRRFGSPGKERGACDGALEGVEACRLGGMWAFTLSPKYADTVFFERQVARYHNYLFDLRLRDEQTVKRIRWWNCILLSACRCLGSIGSRLRPLADTEEGNNSS
jgi:hypothetical protein